MEEPLSSSVDKIEKENCGRTLSSSSKMVQHFTQQMRHLVHCEIRLINEKCFIVAKLTGLHNCMISQWKTIFCCLRWQATDSGHLESNICLVIYRICPQLLEKVRLNLISRSTPHSACMTELKYYLLSPM